MANICRKFQNEFYTKLFWNHEFAGASDYAFCDKNGAVLTGGHSYGSSWWTAGIGTNLVLSKKSDFHLAVERNLGGEVTTKWLVNAGLRFEF